MKESFSKNDILEDNTFKNIFLVISENYFSTIRVFLYVTFFLLGISSSEFTPDSLRII